MTLPPVGDRRVEAQRLGLGAADATFLAAVCVYSGLFTEAQLQKASGASARTAKRHLKKITDTHAVRAVQISGLPVPAYHAFHAGLYADLGLKNIRFRRLASGPETLRRLLAFDYVLERPELPWSATEADKAKAVEGLVDSSHFPRQVYTGKGGSTTERLFAPVKQPLAVGEGQATFLYGDQGDQNTRAFRTWARQHTGLWSALRQAGHSVHVVVACASDRRLKALSAALSRLEVELRPEEQPPDTPEVAKLREDIRTSNWEVHGGLMSALRKLRRAVLELRAPARVDGEAWLSERVRVTLSGAPATVTVLQKKGTAKGRKPPLVASQDALARQMIAEGVLTQVQMAQELGINRSTFYRRYKGLVAEAKARRGSEERTR